MSDSPQTARNLIILLTRTCPLSCPECNIHPQTTKTGHTLNPKILKTLITPALRQQVKGGVIWSGGEPFCALPELVSGLEAASAAGFHSEILTAGTWLSEIDTILPRLNPFKERINLRISLDGPHLRQMCQNDLLQLIERTIQAGIKLGFTLRSQDPYLTPELEQQRQAVFDRIQVLYPDFFARPHVIHLMPHIPQPLPQAGGAMGPLEKTLYKPCKLAEKDRVIAWDGYRYACCGLFFPGENQGHALGPAVPAYGDAADPERSTEILFAWLRKVGPLQLARHLGLSLPDLSLASLPVCSQCRFLFHHHRHRLLDLSPLLSDDKLNQPTPLSIDS